MKWQLFNSNTNNHGFPNVVHCSRATDVTDMDPIPICFGYHADVHRARVGQRTVAVKRFRVSVAEKSIHEENFLREVTVMARLCHPHIAELCGVAYYQNRPSIITPWYKNGTVIEYVQKNPETCRRALTSQIVTGLLFLKKSCVIHGDLKGANILISDDGTVRIADFGLSFLDFGSAENTGNTVASVLQGNENSHAVVGSFVSGSVLTTILNKEVVQTIQTTYSQSGAGSRRWMAPELLYPENFGKQTARKTFESDVFSFAMLVYEIFSLSVPFHKHTSFMAMLNIIEGQRPAMPANISSDLWSVVERSWSHDPTLRPTINDIASSLDLPREKFKIGSISCLRLVGHSDTIL